MKSLSWSALLCALEEAGVPGGNLHGHKETVETPQQKGPLIGIRTLYLLAGMQQHYSLHHPAALYDLYIKQNN
uniref:Uncharacterized protein n=1 Tax=Anguilla anguilla TaxID=7936 RepID=A0A0E9V268_ANGAN